MSLYLLVGFGILATFIGLDMDTFFDEINKSVEKIKRNWPKVPDIIVKMSFASVFVVYWIFWPIFITYVIWEMYGE